MLLRMTARPFAYQHDRLSARLLKWPLIIYHSMKPAAIDASLKSAIITFRLVKEAAPLAKENDLLLGDKNAKHGVSLMAS